MTLLERIQRLRELEKLGSPGEWAIEYGTVFALPPPKESIKGFKVMAPVDEGWIGEMVLEDDAKLAAEARNSLPFLLDALEKAVKTLEFYAKNKGLRINFETNAFESLDCDDHIDFHGQRAREILNELDCGKEGE
jgi:hypothetical protein